MILFIDLRHDETLELEIVQQCAPVIVGIKNANLLILKPKEYMIANQIFYNTELHLYVLYNSGTTYYCLLYLPDRVNEYIQQQAINAYFQLLNYKTDNLDDVITSIAYKYNKYMSKEGLFPHELGLILGYPLCDVIGFIQQNGKGYLHSGYWKVYDHLSEAMLQFYRYGKAKELLHDLVCNGGRLSCVIREIIQYKSGL